MPIDSSSELIFDASTTRLLHLFSKNDRNDDVIEEMICLVHEKAPRLLESISSVLKEEIIQAAVMRCYPMDQVVFRQGDPPDAYYTVIHGAVCLYSDSEPVEEDVTEEIIENRNREKYGKFLMRLEAGSSFGELSFNANRHHFPRKAGVISDGNYGQTQVQINSVEGVKEVESSNVAVLLLIPEKIYMDVLFSYHETKHQTKNKVIRVFDVTDEMKRPYEFSFHSKIDCLKKSILFRSWAMDQLVKLAYSMNKKIYSEGSTICQQGQRFDHIVLLNKGELAVKQTIATGHTNNMDNFISGSIIIQKPRTGKKYKHYPIVVDIAELRRYDVFGLVEYTYDFKKYKRQLVAKTYVEVFLIPSIALKNFLDQERKTAKMIEEISKRRTKWEAVRRDFAVQFFPKFDVTLPRHNNKISQYSSWSLQDMSKREMSDENVKVQRIEPEQIV